MRVGGLVTVTGGFGNRYRRAPVTVTPDTAGLGNRYQRVDKVNERCPPQNHTYRNGLDIVLAARPEGLKMVSGIAFPEDPS